MSSTEQDAASGEITQVIQNTDGAFPYPVLPGPCGIRNPYLLPLPSEAITETEVQINRIEAETDGLETAFEDTVESPHEVGIHREVAESTPCRTHLAAPLEMAQAGREIIRSTVSISFPTAPFAPFLKSIVPRKSLKA